MIGSCLERTQSSANQKAISWYRVPPTAWRLTPYAPDTARPPCLRGIREPGDPRYAGKGQSELGMDSGERTLVPSSARGSAETLPGSAQSSLILECKFLRLGIDRLIGYN
jgi:hypothetical protein